MDSQSRRLAVGLALLLALVLHRRMMASGRAEYRYEDYVEDADRMRVQTHSVWFEYELHTRLAIRGQYVNDALSGATPTGGPGVPDGPEVQLARMEDERNAGFIEADFKWGRTTTTPQFSYSHESDYESIGFSLLERIDFNQRNSTLILGFTRNEDRLKGFWLDDFRSKSTTDMLMGWSQVLNPRTIVTLNLTLGYAHGYLTDPYKGVNMTFDFPPFGPFDPSNPVLDLPPYGANAPELRPGRRFRQVPFISVTHYMEKIGAGVEGSYRFSNDDWGIQAHTFGVQWMQSIGKRVTLTPLLRYHRQSAADFYALRINSDPSFGGLRYAVLDGFPVAIEGDGFFEDVVLPNPDGFEIGTVPLPPAHYSSDYRLSRLETWTMGLGVSVMLRDWISVEAAYKRYVMNGLDRVTPGGSYPSAHVFTLGLGVRF